MLQLDLIRQQKEQKHGSVSSSNDSFSTKHTPGHRLGFLIPKMVPQIRLVIRRWDGLSSFLSEDRAPLYCGKGFTGTKGFVRSHGNLFFYWILGAGHMVSHSQSNPSSGIAFGMWRLLQATNHSFKVQKGSLEMNQIPENTSKFLFSLSKSLKMIFYFSIFRISIKQYNSWFPV